METVKMSDLLDAAGRLVQFAKKHLVKACSIIAFCTLLGFVYSLVQDPSYKGTVSFILDEKSSGTSGGLAGLASQFGFDIAGLGGSSGMLAGDNILDILTSQSIVTNVLLSKTDSSKGVQSATLADRYLDFSGLKNKWKHKEASLSGISFARLDQGKVHSMMQDSILFVLYERLIKKHIKAERLNKKGSIITVTTQTSDPVFSKLFSERLVDETRKLYINVKTGVAAANMIRLEKRADSLQQIINAKSYQSASLQLLDANTAFKTESVPAEVSQRERMVAYAIYTEVMKNLEASRMTIANQTPVMQVLDVSAYPLQNQRPSGWLITLYGALVGLFVCIVLVFLLYPARRLPS
ncbi:MAG: hypothetical protein IM598_06780 [Chitinophagaceae bacterium]|nr:hypothetical protein [Chitinophagaceae bacterium]MCA6459647.1 hypothetical protein [Chitinophagaceae bacterium]MCA6464514.1 hypothetical protein [Chitinophagaceae bacterium]